MHKAMQIWSSIVLRTKFMQIEFPQTDPMIPAAEIIMKTWCCAGTEGDDTGWYPGPDTTLFTSFIFEVT